MGQSPSGTVPIFSGKSEPLVSERSSEKDQAVQERKTDCFVASLLAMTGKGTLKNGTVPFGDSPYFFLAMTGKGTAFLDAQETVMYNWLVIVTYSTL